MPREVFSDCSEVVAHARPADALLDRLAAAGAAGNLLIGVEAEQLAVAENRLRLLGPARDQILHQYLAGKGIAGRKLPQCARQFILVARKPDAPARGADRSLDETRKTRSLAQLRCGRHDPRRRLRQAEFVEQAAEAGLAVRPAIAVEIRQCEAGARIELLAQARK